MDFHLPPKLVSYLGERDDFIETGVRPMEEEDDNIGFFDYRREYSRHTLFEHIYRHHRRYKITEGTEVIQLRKVADFLFGFMGPRKQAFRDMDFPRQGPRGQ